MITTSCWPEQICPRRSLAGRIHSLDNLRTLSRFQLQSAQFRCRGRGLRWTRSFSVTRFGSQIHTWSRSRRPCAKRRARSCAHGRLIPPYPVVLAMDSNSQAFPFPQDSTYLDFLAAGYSDVWSELLPFLPGFTCCQSEADNSPVSALSQRIDLILTKGPVAPLAITLLDADSAAGCRTGFGRRIKLQSSRVSSSEKNDLN